MVKYLMLLLLCAFFSVKSQTVQIPTQYMQKMWAARWISVSNTEGSKYGIYLFRKTFDWDLKAAAFPIYISADNRYKLYVNGQLVGTGPAKSDLFNWNFDIIDLKNYLKTGKNTIAVKIWNEAEFKPEFQISYQTGLIVQGGSPENQLINTDKSWKCLQDKSYEPITVSSYYALGFPSDTTKAFVKGYYVAGVGEKITMEKHLKNWEKTNFEDKNWLNPQIISPGIPKNTVGLDGGNSWRLTPSVIPQMALTKQRFKKLVRAEGMTVSNDFPNETLQIPASTKVIFLLDQSELTNAYPTLLFSGGKNAVINLTYAEALLGQKDKGNRNDIEGKKIIGRKDIILSDGSDNQEFTTLAYRTFRYVGLEIETKDTPLSIDDCRIGFLWIGRKTGIAVCHPLARTEIRRFSICSCFWLINTPPSLKNKRA